MACCRTKGVDDVVIVGDMNRCNCGDGERSEAATVVIFILNRQESDGHSEVVFSSSEIWKVRVN